VGEHGGAQLVNCLRHCQKLESLNISTNELGLDGILQLKSWVKSSEYVANSLSSLNLCACILDFSAYGKVGSMFKRLTSLTSLNLGCMTMI